MTPPEKNVPLDLIQPPTISNEGANRVDHPAVIDMSNDDSDDDTVPKLEQVIIASNNEEMNKKFGYGIKWLRR